MTVGGSGTARVRWTIYCEGFQDRNFLAGLFEEVLAFEALRGEGTEGAFVFRLPGADIWIRQCKGKSKAVRAFDAALREVDAMRPAGLVLCVDERDDDEAPTAKEALGSARDRLHAMVATAIATEPALEDSKFDRSTGLLRLKDGFDVRLASITWCCHDEETPNLPSRQNLERLITAGCCEAYPARGPAVRGWLDSRVEPPTDAPSVDKAFSWSHMAGWFPSPGGDEFFRALWRDPLTRAALCRRMATTGIDALLDSVGVVPPWRPAPTPEPAAPSN